MTQKYKWASGARISINAQKAGERLDTIRKKHKALTPALVLADAKAKTSPLHRAFEWNDGKAADAYRRQQASYLLRSIEVVVEIKRGKREPVRAYLSVQKGVGKREYTPVATVMNDAEMRDQVVKQAWNDLLDWRERYNRIKEFGLVFEAIDKSLPRKRKAA